VPNRSIIDQMPEAAREWLRAKLQETHFSRYIEITDEFNAWAAEQGLEFQVSRMGVFRWAKTWEKKAELLKNATEFAKAAVGHNPDDEGATNELTIRLIQQQVFQLAMEEDLEPKTLASLSRAVADLARASVAQKKWAAEQRAKAQAVAKEVVQIAKQGGLSAELLAEIDRKVLGIAA
jgi:hypothetical protein